MAWNPIYNIVGARFNTGEIWTASIEEEGYGGSPIELKGGASPIRIKYVDNNEEKYPAIRASVATVSFVSDTFVLDDIISSDDKKYRLSIYQESTLQWRGYLSTDDCSEVYISGYREYVLTATDGLGFLKQESYKYRTGEEGINAYGKRILLDIIADCLHYTFTELNIHIQCNVYEDNMTKTGERNPFDQCKVHTKLFLYSDQGPKNMYEILETVMQAFKCTLFQQYGEWHIKRMPDEFGSAAAQSLLYSWPALTTTEVTRRWETYRFTDFNAINASHIRSFIKPCNYSRVIHRYILPDIPMNSNFGRGDYVDTIGTTKRYNIDFWKFYNVNIGAGLPEVAGLYRYEEYDTNNNVSDVYMRMPADTAYVTNARSEEVKVDRGDYIEISGQVRLNQDLGGSSFSGLLYIFLTEDGTGQEYWYTDDLAGEPVQEKWSILNSGWAVEIETSTPQDEWQGFTVKTSPFPVSGTLQLRWRPYYINSANTGLECHIKDVKVNYTLSFNGAEIGVVGEQSSAIKNITSRKTYEENIRLGDAPRRVIASALWRGDNDELLASNWGRLSDPNYDDRLININAEDLQKSNYRVFDKIDGDFLGVTFDSNSKLVGPGNRMIFFPPSQVYLSPTNIEIDVINDTFSATFQEMYDGNVGGKDDGATYFDTTEFKYLYNERS